MPVHGGKDVVNNYFQWGQHGKKYYYRSVGGARIAKDKASLQGRAIEWSKHHTK